MKISYYDKDDNHVIDVFVDSDDYFEVAEEGHRLMDERIIASAVDFQIMYEDDRQLE